MQYLLDQEMLLPPLTYLCTLGVKELRTPTLDSEVSAIGLPVQSLRKSGDNISVGPSASEVAVLLNEAMTSDNRGT
jgi:hypothetical protein